MNHFKISKKYHQFFSASINSLPFRKVPGPDIKARCWHSFYLRGRTSPTTSTIFLVVSEFLVPIMCPFSLKYCFQRCIERNEAFLFNFFMLRSRLGIQTFNIEKHLILKHLMGFVSGSNVNRKNNKCKVRFISGHF